MPIVKQTHWAAVVSILTLLLLPSAAYSHAFGSRYDLPLPLNFYLSAASICVAISFLATFFLIRPEEKGSHQLEIRLNPALCRFFSVLFQATGLLLLILILTSALIGDPSPTKNLATVTIWILWWVGMLLFSALIINLWPQLNPIYTIAQWINQRLPSQPRPLPQWLSYASVIGLLFISWVELVSNISETPIQLFYLIIIYLTSTCIFAHRYGIDTWFNNGDPLTRLFNLLGKMSPLCFTARYSLIIRLPGSGLFIPKGEKPQIASTLFILALMSIVLFDGLSETPLWQATLSYLTESQSLRPLLITLMNSGIDILSLLKTSGILIVFAVAAATYWLLSYSIWLVVKRQIPLHVISFRFALSLMPIAIAYHFSHYISYLLLAGQLILPILSDPLGLGWNLFGTQAHRIDISVINAENVWWIAVVSIITGHIISAVIAHREALRLFSDRKLAIQSQIPMMILMILLTMSSLWILSQPIVS